MTVLVDGQAYDVLDPADYYILRKGTGTIFAIEKTKVQEAGWVDVTAAVSVSRDALLHNGVEVTEANGYRRVKRDGGIRVEQQQEGR